MNYIWLIFTLVFGWLVYKQREASEKWLAIKDADDKSFDHFNKGTINSYNELSNAINNAYKEWCKTAYESYRLAALTALASFIFWIIK